jgi:hypothetical protein
MQGLPREVVGRTPSHIWGACPWFPTAQDRKCHGNHSNIIATYSIPTPKCNSPLSGCFYGVVDYCNLKAVRYQKSRIGNVSSDPPRQGPDQRILHVVTMMMRQQIVTYIFPAPPPFFWYLTTFNSPHHVFSERGLDSKFDPFQTLIAPLLGSTSSPNEARTV